MASDLRFCIQRTSTPLERMLPVPLSIGGPLVHSHLQNPDAEDCQLKESSQSLHFVASVTQLVSAGGPDDHGKSAVRKL